MPLSLMMTYRMSLIWAGFISLDSTFNVALVRNYSLQYLRLILRCTVLYRNRNCDWDFVSLQHLKVKGQLKVAAALRVPAVTGDSPRCACCHWRQP
jgi:hypothetical protein